MPLPLIQFVDFSAVRVLDPPVIAIPNEDVSVWRNHDDGSVTLRIGPRDEIGAATIDIPGHALVCVARTLLAAAEGEV